MVKIKHGICDRCGKETEVIYFENVPNQFCSKCFNFVLAKRIRKNIKVTQKMNYLSEKSEISDEIIDMIFNSVKRKPQIIQSNKINVKETVLLHNVEFIDSLFLYGLFYDDKKTFDLIKETSLLQIPLKKITVEEVYTYISKKHNDEISQEKMKKFSDKMFEMNLSEIRRFAEIKNFEFLLDTKKLKEIYNSIKELSFKYRGVTQSLMKTIDQFRELNMLN